MLTSLSVLAIDDEGRSLQVCRVALRMGGIDRVICCQDAREAMGIMAREAVGVVLLDLIMPHISGQELLARLSLEYPAVPVIVVTGANDIETAVACMKSGAFDYMVKPIERSRLISGVQRAFEIGELRSTCSDLADRLLSGKLQHPEAFSKIVTQDPAMHAVFQWVEAIAVTSRPVLITGETGAGKELIARAVHTLSGRHGKFTALNVAGLDDSMFSDTLFGHKRGAFTGADTDRAGLIADAAGGTLFLDEIGDLSPMAQIKLLRLVQEYEYLPLGTNQWEAANVRVVVATHQDLAALQEAGRFRKDLYYRLKCHHIHIPPLRARIHDIPILFDHFVTQAAAAIGKPKPAIPSGLLDLLAAYSFPGNIREMESMVFDAVSKHSSGALSKASFAESLQADAQSGAAHSAQTENADDAFPFAAWTRLPTLDEAGRTLVVDAMRRANGNQSVAARLLGISQPALSKRLKHMSS